MTHSITPTAETLDALNQLRRVSRRQRRQELIRRSTPGGTHVVSVLGMVATLALATPLPLIAGKWNWPALFCGIGAVAIIERRINWLERRLDAMAELLELESCEQTGLAGAQRCPPTGAGPVAQ